jgi:hypothetical protein
VISFCHEKQTKVSEKNQFYEFANVKNLCLFNIGLFLVHIHRKVRQKIQKYYNRTKLV